MFWIGSLSRGMILPVAWSASSPIRVSFQVFRDVSSSWESTRMDGAARQQSTATRVRMLAPNAKSKTTPTLTRKAAAGEREQLERGIHRRGRGTTTKEDVDDDQTENGFAINKQGGYLSMKPSAEDESGAAAIDAADARTPGIATPPAPHPLPHPRLR